LAPEQQRRYNALSPDRHLVVRVYGESTAGQLDVEVHAHPESQHWFIHVPRAGARYVAELGYYGPDGDWVSLVTSATADTPFDSAAEDNDVRFATAPSPPVVAAAPADVPVPVAPLAQTGRPGDRQPENETPDWTIIEEQALAEIVGWTSLQEREEAMHSVQMALPAVSRPLAAELLAPAEGISSPVGPFEAGGRPEGFWFNINAELIVYGATEPTARVTVGGRPLRLRPDGTFSCRFSLPDGEYELAFGFNLLIF
jgi:hypothetical protein